MTTAVKRLLGVSLALVAFCAFAAPALGAASDPLYVFTPERDTKDPKAPKEPPPAGYLEGPCGVASNSGQLYVSDYYHHAVDIFASAGKGAYIMQVPNLDPLNGPCGIAVDTTGQLYVHSFHGGVVRYTPSVFPPTKGPPATSYGGALTIDSSNATGIAVDSSTNRVYVDARKYIAVYEPNGTPVMDGIEPLRIGLGSLGNGYGVGVTTSGRLYVADASTNTVKVYEPTIDKVNPVATIKGPVKGFNSLRDSAVAVDPATGSVYVVDNQQPVYTEEPEAVVDIFNPGNLFLGVLKYKVFDALPVGLTTNPSGGVIVTSGNTDQAAIYGYGPNPQTNVALPPTEGAVVKFKGTGRGVVTSPSPEISCSSSCEKDVLVGTQLTLTAKASSGSEFAGWSGSACSDSQATCTLDMTEERSVTATFEATAPTVPAPALANDPSPEPSSSSAPSSSAPVVGPKKPLHHRHHKRKHRHRKVR